MLDKLNIQVQLGNICCIPSSSYSSLCAGSAAETQMLQGYIWITLVGECKALVVTGWVSPPYLVTHLLRDSSLRCIDVVLLEVWLTSRSA